MDTFVLVDRSGRYLAECLSETACERERQWRLARDATIVRRSRELGFARLPSRYVAPWPDAKVCEFYELYVQGMPINELAIYFETAESAITSRARRMGIPHRRKWDMFIGKHGGTWTPSEEDLIMRLYRDRGLRPRDIATHLDRTAGAILGRLNKLGIFIPRGFFGGQWSDEENDLIRYLHTMAFSGDYADAARNMNAAALALQCAEPNTDIMSMLETPTRLLAVQKQMIDEIEKRINKSSQQIISRLRGLGLYLSKGEGSSAEWAIQQKQPWSDSAWSDQRDELINFMLDEGIGINEIAQHLEITPNTVRSRLEASAARLSERSKHGRFVTGTGSIDRVLEEAGGGS